MGEIVAVEADGFTVVVRRRPLQGHARAAADGKKVDAGEWAKAANLATGTRLT